MPETGENTATIRHIVTDQGNGGAYCSVCDEDLNHGDIFVKIPPHCHKCRSKFIAEEEPYINMGGSDF